MTLIGPGTWEAARAATWCAAGAADLVTGGERHAFAVTRPPGHHAGRDFYGGSCYLNNAAVACERLIAGGAQRVAILDLDAHHPNGTQAIFWDRPDVLASVNIDPGAGWFPHWVGQANEHGPHGMNLNLVLARGAATTTGSPRSSVSGRTRWCSRWALTRQPTIPKALYR